MSLRCLIPGVRGPAPGECEHPPAPTRRFTVAHVHHEFFPLSETFIYGQIRHLSRFRPVCLADRFVNLDAFPFPPADLFRCEAQRYTLSWLVDAAFRMLARRQLSVERILRRENVRLLHAHFGPSGVRALTYRRGMRLPLVTTFYGYDVSALARQDTWRRRYSRLFEEGDLFLAEGPFLKSRLVDLGCPERKILIQRIGIPVQEIAYRPRMPKPAGAKAVALFSGRFVEKKGLLVALEACAAVRKRNDGFELRIIGDGPLRNEVQNTVERLAMGTYVKLLGFLDYGDYLREMMAADLFLHPSLTARDGDSEGGAPTTILEAQAAGMPVVATTHADIPNVVLPDRSAVLAPEGDVAALAEHIALLIGEQERWASMGAAGRRFVEEHHDIRRLAESLEDRYEALLRST
jgi:colanic acid/amylovoran/stewartan biosynthesis glycosyltransferase WcaL/AmsK/CpsK